MMAMFSWIRLRPDSLIFFLLFATSFLLLFSNAEAQQPKAAKRGTLAGTVKSAATGEALPGASVFIKELALGQAADQEGNFRFTNLRPALYTVEVSLIGYVVQRINAVAVRAEEETLQEVLLQTSPLPLGEEIQVIGKRPLLDVNQPQVTRSLDATDLARSAVTELKEAIASQPGAVRFENEIHLRGGRSYENEVIVDGVPASDPLLRSGFGLEINPAVIEQLNLRTGGLPAEYGQATGGVVEILTRDPAPVFSGRVAYRTDKFGFGAPFDFNSDYAVLELSGPEPLSQRLLKNIGLRLPGSITFLVSTNFAFTDGYLGHARSVFTSTLFGGRHLPREDSRFNGLAKVVWKFDPNHKLSYLVQQSITVNQDRSVLETRIRQVTCSYGYPFVYENLLDNYNVFTHWANLEALTWEHKLSPQWSYDLKLSRFFSNLHSDVNGKEWFQYVKPTDNEPYTVTPLPDSTFFVTRGDGFFDQGDGDTWYDHTWENFLLQGSNHLAVKPNWQTQFGFSAAHRRLEVADIFQPYAGAGGLGADLYQTGTGDAALYFDNEINLKGAIVRAGLRYDLWWPGGYVERVLADTTVPFLPDSLRQAFRRQTFSFFGHRAKDVLSPRFGMSNLITGNLSFIFSYNRLAKWPNPQFVYANLEPRRNSGAYQLFGNPNLNPEKVTLIEAGVKYLIGANDALSIAGYNKSIDDYISAIGVTPDTTNPTQSYLVYFNFDFATSQGVEVEYRKREGDWFEGKVSAAVSRAKGEHALPSDLLRGVNSRAQGRLLEEINFDWDKPWQVNLSANFRALRNRRYRVFGLTLPDNWNGNLFFWAQAGKRYTKFQKAVNPGTGEVSYVQVGKVNDRLGPYWGSFDLTLEKFFLARGFGWSLRLEIQNLFNRKNAVIINPLTGKAYGEGDEIPVGPNFLLQPEPGFRLPIWQVPAQFLAPRSIKLGLAVTW